MIVTFFFFFFFLGGGGVGGVYSFEYFRHSLNWSSYLRLVPRDAKENCQKKRPREILGTRRALSRTSRPEEFARPNFFFAQFSFASRARD